MYPCNRVIKDSGYHLISVLYIVDGCFCTLFQHRQCVGAVPLFKGDFQQQVAKNHPKASQVSGLDLHGIPQSMFNVILLVSQGRLT